MLLLFSIFLPALFSVFFLFTENKRIHYLITIVVSLMTFIIVIFIKQSDNFVLINITDILQVKFSIQHYLQNVFALLASFLSIPAGIYAVSYMHENKENNISKFFFFYHLSIAVTIAIAFSGNLLTIFIFYELLTLLTYPLITHSKNKKSYEAGNFYLGFLMISSLLLFLPAIIIVFNYTGSLDFSLKENYPLQNNQNLSLTLLLMFTYGIAKAAIIPVHGWLPKAMAAPTPVSALLHAVAVVKSGIFSLMMIMIFVFGLDSENNKLISDVLIYISGFTIIVASLVALAQKNLKAILAYSTISQLSYIIMTAALLTTEAIQAAMFYMVMHSFAKITLFFTTGAIYTVTKKKSVNEIKGIGHNMPITFTAFTIGALAMIGLPPTAGFIAKFWIFSNVNEAGNIFMIITMLISTVLNSLYFLPIICNGFFIKPDFKCSEATISMKLPYIITAIGTIILPLLLIDW